MSNQESTPDPAAEAVEPAVAEDALDETTPEPENLPEAETVTPETDEAQSHTSENTNAEALVQAQHQAKSYFDGWQRERADFANYKKRAERDLLTMRFNAKVDTLKSLLPILDDFERAISNVPEDLQGHAWREGIEAIQRKLLQTLENEGIQTLDPVGEPFDPNIHEAIGQDSDTDMESGHVTITLQKGYVCGDRVLRPALVKVAE